MKSYETIVIFKPKLAVEEVDQTVSKIEDIIISNSGKVTAVNKWGVKKIEQSTQGYHEGFYVHYCANLLASDWSNEYEAIMSA